MNSSLASKEMLEYVEKCLGDRGFKKDTDRKTTPHARFEAIAVGVAVALSEDKDLSRKDMSWVDCEEFQTLCAVRLGKRKGQVESLALISLPTS